VQWRDVATIFTDITGFTSLVESAPPETLGALLNEYVGGMTETIFAHEGTVAKIIGDAIQVLFNAPGDQPDYATRAVACAHDLDAWAQDFCARQRAVGVNFGTTTQLRLGMRNGWHSAEVDTGVPALPELDRTTDTSYQLRAFFDTRNSVALPTHGAVLTSRYVDSDDALGGEFDYSLIEGLYAQAFGVRGGNSLTISVGAADTLSGDLPVTELFTLGGIRTFPGLRPGELRGSSYWSMGARYAWRLLDISPLSGQALYAGVRAQVAEMRKRFDGLEPEVLYGLSGSIGGRTPIGPFLFSLGYVDGGEWQVQFMIGRPVAEGSLFDEFQ